MSSKKQRPYIGETVYYNGVVAVDRTDLNTTDFQNHNYRIGVQTLQVIKSLDAIYKGVYVGVRTLPSVKYTAMGRLAHYLTKVCKHG